jgi:arabidopsis histidine kinase 2/3/4 (cytokinin receptor)
MEAQVNEQAEGGDPLETDNTAKAAKLHLPILAMTADVIQATYEECTRCGMDGYVSKPFEENQLFQAVQKFLDPSMPS